jgi:hypothetical protein
MGARAQMMKPLEALGFYRDFNIVCSFGFNRITNMNPFFSENVKYAV